MESVVRVEEIKDDEEEEKRGGGRRGKRKKEIVAVHCRRDGNQRCNAEWRVLYIGGPECAKITLQKSGSRGHSLSMPSTVVRLVYPVDQDTLVLPHLLLHLHLYFFFFVISLSSLPLSSFVKRPLEGRAIYKRN